MDGLDVGPRSSRTVSRHAFLPAATLRWHPVAWPTGAGRYASSSSHLGRVGGTPLLSSVC